MHPLMNIEGVHLHQPGERRQPTAQLIGDFMPMVGTGLLIGDSGIGKTFTALAMASALATGKPFFDKWPIAERNGCDRASRNECGATLFLLSEGQAFFPRRIDAAYYARSHEERIRLVEQGFSGLPIFQMDVSNWHEQGRFNLDKRKILTLTSKLAEMEGDVSLDLIVVDTVSGVFMSPAENDAAITQRTMSRLNQLSQETGAFVLGITHPAKAKAKSEPRGSNVFGATANLKITAERIGRSRTRAGIYIPKNREGAQYTPRTEYALVHVPLPDGQSSMVAQAVLPEDCDGNEPLDTGARFSKYETLVMGGLEIVLISELTVHLDHEGIQLEAVTKESVVRLSNEMAVRDGAGLANARRSVNRAIARLIADGHLVTINHGTGNFLALANL